MSHIVSIDDSPIIRRVIQSAAQSIGYTFLEATNGADGIDLIAENAPETALIVLDVNMPGMNGLKVLEKLKGDPELHRIPVVIVALENQKESVVHAMRIGAANFLYKPFTAQALVEKLTETLALDQAV